MSKLFDKSIRTLELPRVLQLLSEQAVSPEAKELALAVRPETDYEDVLRLLDQTDGARAMMTLPGAPGFSGVKPMRELLDRADRGGSRSMPELNDEFARAQGFSDAAALRQAIMSAALPSAGTAATGRRARPPGRAQCPRAARRGRRAAGTAGRTR